MPTKPTNTIDWVPAGSEPSGGQKTSGWLSQLIPSPAFNWFWTLVSGWVQYLDAPVGTGSGSGLAATGGSSGGPGLQGTGGGTTGKGMVGQGGSGVATGVHGFGGLTSGPGVIGEGTAGDSIGVDGRGIGTAAGVKGTGASGPGVEGRGGGSGDAGVIGYAAPSGAGLEAPSFGSASIGCKASGGTGAGNLGGEFTGTGAFSGVKAIGGPTGPCFEAISTDAVGAAAPLRFGIRANPPTTGNLGDQYWDTAGIPYVWTTAGGPGWQKVSAT